MTEKLTTSQEKATTENRNIISKTYSKNNQPEINILTSLQVMKNLQCIQTSDLSPPLLKLLLITCKQTRYPASRHTAKSKMVSPQKPCGPDRLKSPDRSNIAADFHSTLPQGSSVPQILPQYPTTNCNATNSRKIHNFSANLTYTPLED